MNKKKKIRQEFRDSVFKRDNHKCRKCDADDCKLDAHHITDRNEMPNGGYVKENGISLCPDCHLLAEIWHQSNHEVVATGFHPDELYELIGSSKELAIKKSELL